MYFYYASISGPNPVSASFIKPLIKASVLQPKEQTMVIHSPELHKNTSKNKEKNTCREQKHGCSTNKLGGRGFMNEKMRCEGISPDKKDHKWLDGCLQAFNAGWEKWSHQSFCAADLRGFNELALPKHSLWAACWLSNKLHFTENKSGSLKPQGL